MSEVKIAVVGVGYWGKNIIRVCSELGILAAVCDIDPVKANFYSEKYNVAPKSWSEILADKSITAVAIVVPAYLHAKLIEEALSSNKHVFVEKPLAMSTRAAQQLSIMAETQNCILMVGHILQYHNAYITLKEYIQQGKIGQIRFVESTRFHLEPIRYDVGILWELLPHDLSMLLGIVQEDLVNINLNTQSFAAINNNNNKNLNHADVVDVRLEFTNNIKVRVSSSWLQPAKQQKFWVAGDKGMLLFDDTQPWEQKLIYCKYKDPSIGLELGVDKEYVSIVQAEPLTKELQHFIDCISDSKLPISNHYEALNVINLLEKIEKQYPVSNLNQSSQLNSVLHAEPV